MGSASWWRVNSIAFFLSRKVTDGCLSYKVDPIGELFTFLFQSLVANDRSMKQLTFFLVPPKVDSKVATGLCLGEKKEGCRVVVKLKRLLLFLFLSSFRLGETQVKRQPRFVDPPPLKRAREKKAKAVKVKGRRLDWCVSLQ